MRKKSTKKQSSEQKEIDGKVAARALEQWFASHYVDKKQLYLQNFIRGIFFSIGSIIGATIVLGLLLWTLSLFSEIPFIGDIFENAKQTINSQ